MRLAAVGRSVRRFLNAIRTFESTNIHYHISILCSLFFVLCSLFSVLCFVLSALSFLSPLFPLLSAVCCLLAAVCSRLSALPSLLFSLSSPLFSRLRDHFNLMFEALGPLKRSKSCKTDIKFKGFGVFAVACPPNPEKHPKSTPRDPQSTPNLTQK